MRSVKKTLSNVKDNILDPLSKSNEYQFMQRVIKSNNIMLDAIKTVN